MVCSQCSAMLAVLPNTTTLLTIVCSRCKRSEAAAGKRTVRAPLRAHASLSPVCTRTESCMAHFSPSNVCVLPRAARQRQLQARVRLGPGTPGGEAPLPRAAAVVLYPFTPATEVGVAVALLLQHVAYHTQLGFAKVVQYTQVRGPKP